MDLPIGERQDGFKDSYPILLNELSEETLDELCEDFRLNVFKRAGKHLENTSMKRKMAELNKDHKEAKQNPLNLPDYLIPMR